MKRFLFYLGGSFFGSLMAFGFIRGMEEAYYRRLR